MDASIEQRVGKKLRNTRRLEGLSQAKLAKKCGISASYLCDIENGRATPSFKLTGLLMEAMGYEMVFEKSTRVRMML